MIHYRLIISYSGTVVQLLGIKVKLGHLLAQLLEALHHKAGGSVFDYR